MTAATRRGRRARNDRAIEIPEGLFETVRPGGSHERVYRSLIHAIMSGRFEKGGKLPSEPVLASAFAVSRPVIRQALEHLRRDGLVESMRGSGNYVAGIDELLGNRLLSASRALQQTRYMMDDLEFRLVLEPDAAYFAACRREPADMERMKSALRRFEEAQANGAITHHFDYLFHEAIAIATTNRRFVEAIRSLEYRPGDERIAMRHMVHFRPRGRGAAVLREHGQVLDLIKSRDGEAARRAMWNHIEAARTRLMKHLDALNDATAAPEETTASGGVASGEGTPVSSDR